MPKYRYQLANGKSLVLEGDRMPSDAEVEAAADEAGVRTLLMSDAGDGASDDRATSPAGGPLGVVAADAGRRAAVRVGEQIATSPNVTKVVKAVSGPAAQMASRAVGATGGIPGYLAGEAVAQTMRSPAVARGGESAVRSMAARMASMLGSQTATAMTSPLATVAAMPITEAGDRPVGENPATTAARQRDFTAQYQQLAAAKAERMRTGNLSLEDWVEAALDQLRGKRR